MWNVFNFTRHRYHVFEPHSNLIKIQEGYPQVVYLEKLKSRPFKIYPG